MQQELARARCLWRESSSKLVHSVRTIARFSFACLRKLSVSRFLPPLIILFILFYFWFYYVMSPGQWDAQDLHPERSFPTKISKIRTQTRPRIGHSRKTRLSFKWSDPAHMWAIIWGGYGSIYLLWDMWTTSWDWTAAPTSCPASFSVSGA